MKQNLARYKVPREIVFLDELPRNATGKVLKRELADADASDDGPDDRTPGTDPGTTQGGGIDPRGRPAAPDFTLRDQHGAGRDAVVVPRGRRRSW